MRRARVDPPDPDIISLRTRYIRLLVGVGLALLATLAVVSNQRDVGIARDEMVYMPAGARNADWWIGLVTFQHGVSSDSIGGTFGCPPTARTCEATANNREHPPLMKTLFGLSERLLDKKLGVVDELTAFRLPSAIVFGLGVLLVYLFVLELWGLSEAVIAAILLTLLPRALFHAGLACFDAPIMTWWFAAIYAYWRCFDGRKWPWQAGVVWGLALATKHTALLLPFAFGSHYLIATWNWHDRTRGWHGWLAHWRIVVSLAVLGPLTLFVLWPWLWLDPIGHVGDWLRFHLEHVNYHYEYLGKDRDAPPFPWHVPLVTTLFTVPIATLASALAGAVAWIRSKSPLPRKPVLLLVVSAAAAIGPFAVGSTPIFGAEKHWMPVLPTICIAAGVGIVWAARRVAELVKLREIIPIAVVGGAVAIAALTETVTAEPYALTWLATPRRVARRAARTSA